jgi:hypothetical protein
MDCHGERILKYRSDHKLDQRPPNERQFGYVDTNNNKIIRQLQGIIKWLQARFFSLRGFIYASGRTIWTNFLCEASTLLIKRRRLK